MKENKTASYHIDRQLNIKQGPAHIEKGDLSEEKFVRIIDSFIEVKPRDKPKDIFILLISPHRNGNSNLMENVLSQTGENRTISKCVLPQAKGYWDASQYPRILEGLAPKFRTSKSFRNRLQYRFIPIKQRITQKLVDFFFILLLFSISSIVFSTWFRFSSMVAPFHDIKVIAKQTLSTLTAMPFWIYGVCALFSISLEILRRKWDLIKEKLSETKNTGYGYRLSESEYEFLAQDQYAPIRFLYSKIDINPVVMWIDRAGGLDNFSKEALCHLLFASDGSQGSQLSNRIFILQFDDTESLLYRQIYKHCQKYANPEERLIMIELLPVALEDRIEIAIQLGKTVEDARSTNLIADLIEVEEPQIKAIENVLKELIQEEIELTEQPGAGLLLSFMATASADGPRQFSESELRKIFTRQKSTFSRWMNILGKKPYFPGNLNEILSHLETLIGVPLVRKKRTGGSLEWAVDPLVSRTLIEIIPKTMSFINSCHSFWVAYIGERFEGVTIKSMDMGLFKEEVEHGEHANEIPKNKLDTIVVLSFHLLHVRLPEIEEVSDAEALGNLARLLVFIATQVISILIELTMFDRSYDVFKHLFSTIIKRKDVWSSAGFVREIERLSEQIWRLASIRGVSESIVKFHQFVQDRGARVGSKGISSSVYIFDAYNRATKLEEIDLAEIRSLSISGGSEATRSYLINMRSYCMNIALLRKYALVLESLESLPSGDFKYAEKLFSQFQKPVSSNQFDFFEYLVCLQSIRLHLCTKNIDKFLEEMELLANRLNEAQNHIGDDDLLVEALCNLIKADMRIISLGFLFCFGGIYLSALRGLPDLLKKVFKVKIYDPGELRNSINQLIDRIEDALEDAMFLQEMCKVSLGKAYLLNAKMRYYQVLWILNRLDKVGDLEEVRQKAYDEAHRIKCQYLAVGSLVIRAGIKKDVETCTTCLKSIVEVIISEQLEEPAHTIIPLFYHYVLSLHDRRMYTAAADAMSFLTNTTPPEKGLSGYLEWAQNKIYRGQMLRLTDEPEKCLIEIQGIMDLETDQYGDDKITDVRNIKLNASLQACWCYEKIKDTQNLQRILDETLSIQDVDQWHAFPHLVTMKFKQKVSGTNGFDRPNESIEIDSLVNEALDQIGAPRFKYQYSIAAIISLLTLLMEKSKGSTVLDTTLFRLKTITRKQINMLDEWVGYRTAIYFLDAYFAISDRTEPNVMSIYENFAAREMLSSSKLEEINKNLQQGSIHPMLDYIFQRFHSLIGYYDEKNEDGKNILKQIDQQGIGTLTKEQLAFCLDRSQLVSSENGKIHIHIALVLLKKIGEKLSSSNTFQNEMYLVKKSIYIATSKILKIISREKIVHPRLSQAMTTYLKICEAFERVFTS